MEGAVFYLIFWSLWVYITFILQRKYFYRLKLAAMILIIIIFSGSQFSLGPFHFFSSGMVLLFFSYLFISQEKKKTIIYLLICSLIVTIAYVSFHLFEIYDPIWIIFNKDWMQGICIGFLAVSLQKTLKGRLLVIVSGTMQGELLYAYFLNQYQFPYTIGSFDYLDVCSLVVVLLLGWSLLENAGTFFQNYFHFSEKEKQKSS
ncbi:YphA family membrane protein [Neobacillus endophyticus]